jgi:hypothetical protein
LQQTRQQLSTKPCKAEIIVIILGNLALAGFSFDLGDVWDALTNSKTINKLRRQLINQSIINEQKP